MSQYGQFSKGSAYPRAGAPGGLQTPVSTPGTPPPLGPSFGSYGSQQSSESTTSESHSSHTTKKESHKSTTAQKSGTSTTEDTQISFADLYRSEWIKVRVIAQPDPLVLLRHPAIKDIITRTMKSVTSTIEETINEEMKSFQKKLVETISEALEEGVTKGFNDEVDKIPTGDNPFTATHTDNLHMLAEEHHLHAAGTLIQAQA